MIGFLLSLALITLVFHFLYRLGKAYVGRKMLLAQGRELPSEVGFVSVIVPARDEEANIESCVTSLTNQSYPQDGYKIIVVDDNSTDGTAAIVRRIQEAQKNLHLIEAGSLPKGWKGKNHACWVGVQHGEGEWYCFVDADIRAEPELLRSAVTLAHTRKVDMLSVNPFQELVSMSERLLLPGVFISIAASMDMEGVNDPSKPEAIANGQFILFRRSTYNAMKGHYAVRDEIMEDLAFARLTKRSGYRLYWLFGDQLIRTRMYRNFPKIWEGFSKNLTEIMRTRGIAHELFTAAKSFVLGWLPVVLPILTWQNLSQGAPAALRYGAFWLSATAAFALLVNNLMTVRALRLPIGYALSVQMGYLLHAALIIASLWKKRKGKREWKGRVYE